MREDDSYRFTTFIGAAEGLVPPETLAGGRTEHPNALLIVPPPTTAVTFFSWMPAAPVFPLTGTGTAVDPRPRWLMLWSAMVMVLVVGWCVSAVQKVLGRGKSHDHRF